VTNKIVEVEWEDSTSFNGWKTPDVVARFVGAGSMKCRTTGYLLHKDRNRVAICQSIGRDEDNEFSTSIAECLIIPRKCVKSIVELEKK